MGTISIFEENFHSNYGASPDLEWPRKWCTLSCVPQNIFFKRKLYCIKRCANKNNHLPMICQNIFYYIQYLFYYSYTMKHTYPLQEIPHFLTVKFLNKLSQLKNNFEVHQMSIDSYSRPPALNFGVQILLLLPLVHPFTFLCISMMRSN